MPQKNEGTGRTSEWSKTILGEPSSKANSRRLVHIKGRTASVKSKKALRYVKDFQAQCPVLQPMFLCNVEVKIKIYYASRRPDLDESVILDAMQGFIYANDRQVRRKVIEWGLDRDNPRAEITVRPLLGGEDPDA